MSVDTVAVDPESRDAYLAQASERFRATFAALEQAVAARFPSAQPCFEWSLPGWRVPLLHVPPHPTGTFDHTCVVILLADRKAGITLHLWNPANYRFLDEHKAELTGAGFKVMRGCLQFNRKQPYPVEAVDTLLGAMEL
jgi:uncharacterized protein YdhG (YjbR/CyaY superfamily)